MAGQTSFPNPPRVLVIDDDPTILQLMQAVLADEGYLVDTALNGVAALDGATHGPPELLVLDMYLPGVSGPELIEALRERCGGDFPVLVVSASNVDEEAQAFGAYEYLPKPFDLDDFLAAVRRGLAPRP